MGKLQQPDPAQRGGAVVVEEVVGGVDGLVEADGGHRVGQPDQRGLHGDLLDEQRESAGGPQQSAYLPVLLVEIDRLAARGPDPAQEQLDRRPFERRAVRGDGERADPHHGLVGLVGRGQRGHDDAGVGRAVQHRLEHGTGVGGVEVETVEHQQAVAAVDGAAEGAGQGVAGSGLRVEALQGRDEEVVERTQVARVDPRRLQLRGDVAHDQRLAAAGRSHDRHPPRLVERLAQRALDVVATQARREHGTNLSLMRR